MLPATGSFVGRHLAAGMYVTVGVGRHLAAGRYVTVGSLGRETPCCWQVRDSRFTW